MLVIYRHKMECIDSCHCLYTTDTDFSPQEVDNLTECNSDDDSHDTRATNSDDDSHDTRATNSDSDNSDTPNNCSFHEVGIGMVHVMKYNKGVPVGANLCRCCLCMLCVYLHALNLN